MNVIISEIIGIRPAMKLPITGIIAPIKSAMLCIICIMVGAAA
jgi:hypothetical protein